MTEIVVIPSRELIVIDDHRADTPGIEIHIDTVELIEIAEQGPRGPPGTDVFDDDLVLLYQIYKL